MLDIEFDEEKNLRNIKLRNLSFDLVHKFNFQTATIDQDKRFDYGGPRWQAIGYIENRLFVLIFTKRNNRLRVISLRKANKREENYYVGKIN